MRRWQLVIDDTGSVEDIHAFIYCKKWRSGQVLPMPHSLTHSQRKDSATQLLIKYKSGALVTQYCHKRQIIPCHMRITHIIHITWGPDMLYMRIKNITRESHVPQRDLGDWMADLTEHSSMVLQYPDPAKTTKTFELASRTSWEKNLLLSDQCSPQKVLH